MSDRLDEYALADKFDFSRWKKILKYINPYKRDVFILLFAAVVTAFFDAIFPVMTKFAISSFITPGKLLGLGRFALAFLTLGACQALFNVVYSKKAIVIEMGVGRDMKDDLFSHVQELSMDYFNSTPVGFIHSRVMLDTNSIGTVFSWGLSDFVFNTAYILFAAVNMIILSPFLACIVLLTIPVVAGVTGFFRKRMLIANRQVRRQNSLVTSAYNEDINGAPTIKELDCRDRINREFGDINLEMKKKSLAARHIENVFFPLIMIISSVALGLVLGLGPGLVAGGKFGVDSLAVFISYTFTLLDPVESIARSITRILALQANVERVNALQEAQPTVKDTREVTEKYGGVYDPKPENWEPIKGDVEFKHVWFRYPGTDRYVLEDFNLKIPAGSCIAIVGPTGRGKSTLVNLVCRFWEPERGQILIDGVDYRQRSYLWLESNLSYVLQTPHLFSGTIRDNIKYARPNATDREMIRAAKTAQAHSFITALPEGYDTPVGQSGDRLSTGQKQLVSIARAVLADGKILVMDEATSSVDTQTEQLINGVTGDLLRGRTGFLIAHRLSTVKNADMIIVVEDGKITEMGTHPQLLRKEGLYYRMYTGQWEEERQEDFWKGRARGPDPVKA